MQTLPAMAGRPGPARFDGFPTLVLNADFQPLKTFPLSVMSWQKATRAVFKGKVDVVESYDQLIRSARSTMPVPKVVVKRDYVAPPRRVACSRMAIVIRDRCSCQYCGRKLALNEVTFDHVIPRAAGGGGGFDNLLVACVACNGTKGCSAPNFSGRKGVRERGRMRPLKSPREPSFSELYSAGFAFIPPGMRSLFGDWLPLPDKDMGPRQECIDGSKPFPSDLSDETYWTVELVA